MSELLSVSVPAWMLLAYLSYMCAVQAMPRPTEQAGPGYVWLYRFAHLLSMNLQLFLDPMKKLRAELPEEQGGFVSTTAKGCDAAFR